MDLDKVLKGLRCCQVDSDGDLEQCNQCPYNSISIVVQECRTELCKDALDVISELREARA